MIQNHKKNKTCLMKNTSYPAKMSLELTQLTICQKNGEKKRFLFQGSLAEKCMV